MTTQTFPSYSSRLSPEITARTRRRIPVAEARATTAQSALEYILFAVFGTTILIAAIALIVTNSASFRRVPNLVGEGIRTDRVNILMMQTYRAGQNDTITTDALMLMSIKPSTREVAVTSIPRDLWVKLGNYGQRRLGAAPAVAKSAGYPGEGPGLTADTIATVLGQPVHAYVRLERRDLVQAINAVGGIDIDVEQSFIEYRRHERFTRGHHHLDGQRALRYAFSPFVVGPANDRFAREARQQQIIAALAAKGSTSRNVARIATLTLGDHTNLTPQQISWLATTVSAREPRRVTLAPYMDTFEVATIADTGVAVRPRNGDYRQIRELIANVFTQTAITTN
ncbi:MAG TPA: LCP family protein [Thermoanaerobaculia bacterium]|jgi:LCP family protein required for cell wall assembly|nr:LCP family protein [Thermoanaerobaculia bacterium]